MPLHLACADALAQAEQERKLEPRPRGTVYFVRHGESTANNFNVYSGNVWDVPLTSFGELQVRAPARCFLLLRSFPVCFWRFARVICCQSGAAQPLRYRSRASGTFLSLAPCRPAMAARW